MRTAQRGSATVEAVLVAPVLLLLVAFLIAGGRIVGDQAALRALARDVARVAVTANGPNLAVAAGRTRATELAASYGFEPRRLAVRIDPGAFVRGATVTVRVGYKEILAPLPSWGLLPAQYVLRADHTERIDPYRSR